MAHIYNGILAIKRNEIELFVVRWMDLESVIQSHEEPRGRTGIKTQTYLRMDLRTRGGGRVSRDKVRESHGHIYTTKCKIDS